MSIVTGESSETDLAGKAVNRYGGYFVVVPPGATYGPDIAGALIRSLAGGWRTLVVAALLGLGLGLGLSFLLPRVYRAEVTLVTADEDRSDGIASLRGGLGNLASLAGLSSDGGAVARQALAVLQSNEFAEKFIRGNNLLPVLFPEAIERGDGRGAAGAPTIQDATDLFQRRILRVVVDEDQSVFRVRVYWSDPHLAAAWANALVASLNERLRTGAIAEADRNIDFLQTQLRATPQVELRNAITQLIQQQLEKRMVASVRKQFAFRVIDPARISDDDKYVRPSHVLYACIGLMGGLFGAVAWLLWRRRSEI